MVAAVKAILTAEHPALWPAATNSAVLLVLSGLPIVHSGNVRGLKENLSMNTSTLFESRAGLTGNMGAN